MPHAIAPPFKIAFLGNRMPIDDIIDQLYERIQNQVSTLFASLEQVEVYATKRSDFDLLVSSAVKHAQEDCPNKSHRLILVSPFEEANQGRRMEYYDSIVSLSETGVRGEKAFKQATLRMARDCHMLLVCDTGSRFGHTARCVRKAKKAGATVLFLIQKARRK